ncbi:glutamate 5-kinase [Secundilactobacillus paracollinoides]|uniref:glutamate 5-kinase n=1 Tax=Secundilactobacillus paracollinoides TaxID=240427 RepID=UPI0006D21C75|nr:glutamate 5-kinase [Secundilactobacillus paracollinoides]KRL79185.1 glutamate 5-kinase [Secundilactobacillus paracollinoides DSM 15502 = JCM 11969]
METASENRKMNVKRLVVKVGTSSLVYPNGKMNLETIDQLAFVLSTLCGQGKEVILVSSGAIGVGLNALRITERPTDISAQQALASIGQSKLITLFNQRFDHYNQAIGQLLLTHDVFDFPASKQHVLDTFDRLLSMHIVPIVNENDSVAVDELDHKTKFGDNDQLSAIVAMRTDADLLVMLSDTEGFYDANPMTHDDAQLISTIHTITDDTYAVAGGKGSRYGTGGMVTKLRAAEMMMNDDKEMVLASGADPAIILDILAGKPLGTWFVPERKGALKNG